MKQNSTPILPGSPASTPRTTNRENTPHKILQLLKDGQFHSGELLGETLNMTRSAIWKGIQQLQTTYGLEIESISGRGYRIAGGLQLLNKDAIWHGIDTPKQDDIDLILLEQTNSTNDYLLAHPAIAMKPPYTIALAEQQLQGRGRQGRQWSSPYGHNIYLSLAWQCNKDPSELSGLSLTTAIAVIRALKAYGIGTHLHVKWPNDILYGHDKLGGILLDIKAESHSTTTVVMGIGINTFLPPDAAKIIDQPWTSLHDILHKPIDRNRLASLLINNVIDMLTAFDASGFPAFLSEWNEYDSLIGQPVTIKQGDKKILGIMQGVSESGELLIKNAGQQLQTFISGEVSLRRQN